MKQTDGAKKQLELLLQRYPILAGQRDEIDGPTRSSRPATRRAASSSLQATAVRQRMRSISWAS